MKKFCQSSIERGANDLALHFLYIEARGRIYSADVINRERHCLDGQATVVTIHDRPNHIRASCLTTLDSRDAVGRLA